MHFDFVEIGTSNWATITQACAGHSQGKKDVWKNLPLGKKPSLMRGLAVDMKKEYLDQLPDLPLVTKVHAAVTGRSGHSIMEHVPESCVKDWKKIFAKRGNEDAYQTMHLELDVVPLRRTSSYGSDSKGSDYNS